jgi:hypothetical protein
MKKFNYFLPTTDNFCASFDQGFVFANNLEEAKAKAIRQLNYDVEKANAILASSDNTFGFSISINTNEIEVDETTETIVDVVIDQIKQDLVKNNHATVEKLLQKIPFEALQMVLNENKHLVD